MKVYNNTDYCIAATMWQSSETSGDQEPERDNIPPQGEYELNDTPGTETSLMGPNGECTIKVLEGVRQITERGDLHFNVIGRNMGMISAV